MANIRWTNWPWARLPAYEDKHILEGALDSFFDECDELGMCSPLTHLNGLSPIPEEEVDSETGHMTAAQASVPTE